MGVLVTDVRRMAVASVEMSPDTEVHWLGSPGSGALEFDMPAGLAARPTGGFVVADSGNARIAAVSDDSGSDWAELGTRGQGDGEFDRPMAVALDADGRIVIADTGNCRIVRVDDLSGSGWTAYGERGEPDEADPAGIGRFREPVAVAVESDGTIVVTDRVLMRVVRFGPDFDGSGWAATGTVDPPIHPVGVAATTGGALAVSELGRRRVTIRGALDQAPTASTLPGALAGPGPVADDSDGGHVVLDIVSRRLLALVQNGSVLQIDAERRLGNLGIDRPLGMCIT